MRQGPKIYSTKFVDELLTAVPHRRLAKGTGPAEGMTGEVPRMVGPDGLPCDPGRMPSRRAAGSGPLATAARQAAGLRQPGWTSRLCRDVGLPGLLP